MIRFTAPKTNEPTNRGKRPEREAQRYRKEDGLDEERK